MSMGARLAQTRRGQNLTQEQLAERLGVTRQAVSRWESDTAYPETDKIVRMAALFGVSCDYLLAGGEGKTAPGAGAPPSPVTRLLRDAVGKRVTLAYYEDESVPAANWCRILDFDGGWANVEFVRERKNREDKRETRLIPLSSIRSITFLKEGGEG